VVVVRRINPRGVGLGVVAWAIIVGFCMFVAWTAHHAGISTAASDLAYAVAGILTALVGLWLGWNHRTGTAFVAPFLAWIVLVPFAFASEFLRAGFLGGLWRGFLLAIAGGFVTAFVEGVLLVAFAVLGRILAAAVGHRDDATTVILPPRSG
jgi:hypothetical protein